MEDNTRTEALSMKGGEASANMPSKNDDYRVAGEPGAFSPLGTSPTDNTAIESPLLSATDSMKSPRLSRNASFSSIGSYQDDWEAPTPSDRLTVLDLLDNFTLPQQLEKLQRGISAQASKVRRSREAIKSKTQLARDRVVDRWRQRVPSADEQLDRYRQRMKQRVDKLGKRWNDTKVVSMREKISFICGVMNIFVSGYLIGALPEYFHIWYTVQLFYFLPLRTFIYRRRGYHYFLVDLCYFVNFLLTLSLWGFPGSKRLFMAAYCLAFGNNAVAVIMWRNSLVFHSFDKITTVFIHIMPCATLHCIVHLFDPQKQKERFPGLWAVKHSEPGSPTAYGNLVSMLIWSSLPYAVWQLTYYFLITVRRREQIAAGRPTSFTWLLKSYSKTWLGKLVLSLPEYLQEPAFMLIQYGYAVLTILPCPIWFHSRYASGGYLFILFTWSIYNGSTYYIDVFGKRFQKELEAMRAEVTKWQNNPELMLHSPLLTPQVEAPSGGLSYAAVAEKGSAADRGAVESARGSKSPAGGGSRRTVSVDDIPLLDENAGSTTGAEERAKDAARERKHATS